MENQTNDIKPRLTLVGAGPGAHDLITLRGLKALQEANIVLFDALIAEELLDYIPKGIPAMAVGKRAGKHSFKQDEINALIVSSALQYGHVVRLKGGDPFVFGRGQEEIDYAAAHGVITEVVPGVSSALAVPASVNIPVTSRKVSESFWVVTGTTQAGLVSEDVALAAKSTATVVILMGLNKIDAIMESFRMAGKSETPVAVIQNGTLKSARMVVGNVSTIVALARVEGIESPAVIVVGEVVKYAHIAEAMLQQSLTQ